MFLHRFSYVFFVNFRYFFEVLFLREHAGTLYFTREYACRQFHSNKGVFFFDSVFPAVFGCAFFQFWHAKTEKIRVNASAEAKVASRCRFGAFLVDFWPSGSALLASLGRPEALLGRFGAALGPQKVKNGLEAKLAFDSWSPNSSQEVEKDAFQDILLWILMIFVTFTRQKCNSYKNYKKNIIFTCIRAIPGVHYAGKNAVSKKTIDFTCITDACDPSWVSVMQVKVMIEN